jgi:hypothetical protein
MNSSCRSLQWRLGISRLADRNNRRPNNRRQVEAAFSQPNSGIAQQMLSWAQSVTKGSSDHDLLGEGGGLAGASGRQVCLCRNSTHPVTNNPNRPSRHLPTARALLWQRELHGRARRLLPAGAGLKTLSAGCPYSILTQSISVNPIPPPHPHPHPPTPQGRRHRGRQVLRRGRPPEPRRQRRLQRLHRAHGGA